MLDYQSLPAHCTPTVPFLTSLSTYFGVCMPLPLAFISTLLGTLSIVSWLFAQMPQIYKNYQIKSTAGLSLLFLGEWVLGDLANLLGAMFTKQAAWQIVIASYYLFVDLCLLIQYFWYTHFKPRIYEASLHSDVSNDDLNGDNESINALSPINTNFAADMPNTSTPNDHQIGGERSKPDNVPHFSLVNYEKHDDSPRLPLLSSPSPRTLQYATALSLVSQATALPLPAQVHNFYLNAASTGTTLEVIGTILSWTSTLLYLTSRIPQLYHNWNRKSTAGLSPLLFITAFCGNFFYSTSMLTNPNAWSDFPPYGGHGWADSSGNDRVAWLTRAAPFFFGAAGVLVLDAAIAVQFLVYGENDVEKVVKVRDEHGHSHWERVNGWMRGWIPTVVGKEKVVDMRESQRLLAGSRERTRSYEYGI